MFAKLKEYHGDKAYATVRMCAATYKRLRKAFGADEQRLPSDTVRVKGSVMLVRRGYGWYRLHVLDSGASLQRVKAAVSDLLAFFRKYEEDLNFQLRQLLGTAKPVEAAPAPVVIHVKRGISKHPYQKRQRQIVNSNERRTPSPHRLQALADKFNSRRLQ